MYYLNQTHPSGLWGGISDGSTRRQCKQICSFISSFETSKEKGKYWQQWWRRKATAHLTLNNSCFNLKNTHDFQTAQQWVSCLTCNVFTCRTAVFLGWKAIYICTVSGEKPKVHVFSNDYFYYVFRVRNIIWFWSEEEVWPVCLLSLF